MNRIERVEYLSKLKKFRDKKLIKVVTGIRRCGKSTLMEIYRYWLISQGVSSDRIVFINFEDYDFLVSATHKTSMAMSRGDSQKQR